MRSERLAGKIALVTGAGAGIGRGIALMFARHGATVIGCDISSARCGESLALASQEGLALELLHPVDLTRATDVQRCVEQIRARHGRLDVLVNAAAIEPHMAPVASMDYEKQFRPTLVGELDLVFLMCNAAWPLLKIGGASAIVNFSSVNSSRGSQNMGMAAHCAGKAAVEAFTRQLAVEGGAGIRANAIAPGMVITPATQAAGASVDGPIKQAILARVPVKRLGLPEDIAWCAVFLASDEASWITGATIAVDGGVTCC
ncbi:MAG TPA: SDR family oxidoreductase [Steroidobacteraceae bacterium]|nr:SDR family oxidoreductase [Steroidobacteraceae bacterium]